MSGLGAFLFFGMVSLAGRSLLILGGIIGLVLSLAFIPPSRRLNEILKASLTGYLPFLVLVLAIAPFQEKATDVLWVLSIPASYLLARIIRMFLPIRSVLVGVGFVGLFLGGVHLLSLVGASELLPTIAKLSEYHHKNGVGWTLAFGAAAFTILGASGGGPPLNRLVYTGLSILSGIAMIFVGSVTSLLASLVAIGLYLCLRAVQVMRFGPSSSRQAGLAGGFFLVVLLGVTLLIANFFGGTGGYLSTLLGREASLTGRTRIWDCYLEGRVSETNDIGQFVRNCSGISVGSLHSSFLEADRYGGPALAFTLLFGFLLAIFAATRGVLSARSDQATDDAALSIMFALIGFVIATVESYVFSGFVYISILVFLAPGLRDWTVATKFRKRLVPRTSH